MPAISTTRWSCISPQRPRTEGARRALTRFPVSARSAFCVSRRERTCSDSEAYANVRAFSSFWIFSSTFSSESRTGRTISAMAICRFSRSPLAASAMRPRDSRASCS